MKLPDIDLSRVETEWQRFRSNIPEVWKFANDGREFQVGEEFKARGKMAEFPVVIVPGIVSTVRNSPSSSYVIFILFYVVRASNHGQPTHLTVPSSAKNFGAGSI